MASDAQTALVQLSPAQAGRSARDIVVGMESKELFFAVVGHVGSGTTEVAKELKKVLSGPEAGPAFDVEILKARHELVTWDSEHSNRLSKEIPNSIGYARALQDLGDEMRGQTRDHAAVARALIRKIRSTRAQKVGVDAGSPGAIKPDGEFRAYILDSIRHPAEVQLLSHIYQDAFILVGVVCDEAVREKRLSTIKFRDAGLDIVRKFMQRDAKDEIKHGQRVQDAFHLAHYFLDNTEDRTTRDNKPNVDWKVAEQLTRLKKIVTHAEVVRPKISETAMFAAQGSQLRSACLSRQVGAAVVDAHEHVVSIGTNEVPRAGGGVYGDPDFGESRPDERCVHGNKYCSNTKEQQRIMSEVAERLIKLDLLDAEKEDEVIKALKASPIGGLLEFSRAVHAEMDALLSLARRGVPTTGTRVFVTTFPCHYCARHLVSAGVDEVQYIEPYPKSKALELHNDSIVTTAAKWSPPSQGGTKVLFRPFVGVAPRLYSRAFTKAQDLKTSDGNFQISAPEWTGPTRLGQLSYTDLEWRLTEQVES